MREKDLPEILKPFYEPPEEGCRFNTRLGKNRDYVRKLAAQRESVRESFFSGLKILEAGLPEDPNGSFAGMHILEAAVQLASSAEVPLFLEMLSWRWISTDYQYPLYVLSVAKLGYEDDIPLLREFCRQVNAGKHSAPDKKRIFDFTEEAIEGCRLRGPRNTVVPSALSEAPNNLGYVR